MLGVSYRRIPLLAIGRDVYLDTRLQLPVLESCFPELPQLGFSADGDTEKYAIQQLLSVLTNEAGVFATAGQLLPTNLPVLNDPTWFKDRSDFSGAALSKQAMERARPGAEVEMLRVFRILEDMLRDGREWIAGSEKASLADIEAVWPVHWLTSIPGALPEDKFSEETFPKVYAWIGRFQEAVTAAKKRPGSSKPIKLGGQDAANLIFGSQYSDDTPRVDEKDSVVVSQGLKAGDQVEIWPADTGKSRRDRGTLVALDGRQAVIEIESEGQSLRVHTPRHGFHLKKLKSGLSTKL